MSSTTNATATDNDNNLELKGQVECGCKAIKLHVREGGPDFHNKLSQPVGLCHCIDCVRFVTICYEASKKKFGENENNKAIDVLNHDYLGTINTFFYPSNVTCIKGYNDIGWHKLTKESSVNRFYCKKCGTPIGGILDGMSTTFTYRPLIKKRTNDEGKEEEYDSSKETYVAPEPMYAAFCKDAPSVEYTNKHDTNPNITAYSTVLIKPILHFMGRKLIAYVMGYDHATFDYPKEEEQKDDNDDNNDTTTKNVFSIGREADDIVLL